MADQLSVEEQLERTEKEVDDLRRALDQSSIVAITDSKGTITYVNQLFCDISKYSREELIGQNHRIINSEHHPKEFFVDLWKTIASGKVWKGEIKNKAKDGGFYWVFTTIVPFLTPKGRPFQYVAIRTDITELKLAQEREQLQRAALAHAEKMASVGELASGIAHELGNPLATISGRVELLERDLLAGRGGPEATLKTLETIKRLTDRMAGIIRGMRSMSRDGSKDPAQPVLIGQLLNDVLGFTWESCKRHQIRVEVDEIPNTVTVWGQETQLSQVFVNLINNAKDAVQELEERWIKVAVLDQPEQLQVKITDSGRGIPESLREKIMEPFFTTKAMGKGSGLGLSVSKTIIEAHGGTLEVCPDSPNTQFVIVLPKTRP